MSEPISCQCFGSGYCQLMRREMSEVRYNECRNKPHYFEMFLKDAEKRANQPTLSRGLGDTVARAIKAVSVKPKRNCDCRKRQERLNQLVPRNDGKFHALTRWAVGVTTAPRTDSTLNCCLASFESAGWSDIVIFAEPESDLSGFASEFRTRQHRERMGAWRNWVFALRYLLEYAPKAEAIMLIQDDTVACRGLRDFLERDLWPDPNIGVISPYTPRHYALWSEVVYPDGGVLSRHGNVKNAKREAGRRNLKVRYAPKEEGCLKVATVSLWGACCLVFPRPVAERIARHSFCETWQGASAKTRNLRKNPRQSWEIANIDTAVGRLMGKFRMPLWFYVPSLAQHIADTSSLNHGGATGNRRAIDFVGEDFDVNAARQDWPLVQRYLTNGQPHPK